MSRGARPPRGTATRPRGAIVKNPVMDRSNLSMSGAGRTRRHPRRARSPRPGATAPLFRSWNASSFYYEVGQRKSPAKPPSIREKSFYLWLKNPFADGSLLVFKSLWLTGQKLVMRADITPRFTNRAVARIGVSRRRKFPPRGRVPPIGPGDRRGAFCEQLQRSGRRRWNGFCNSP